MRKVFIWVLMVAVGIAIGAVGNQGIKVLSAQGTTPPGYVIEEIDVHDLDTFKTYVAQVPATLAPFKGRYLVRAGKTESLQGQPPKGIVLIAFDSMATARQWYESPSYQAILPIRQRSATARAFIVEGVAP